MLADRALPEVLPENCRVRSFASRTRVGRGATLRGRARRRARAAAEAARGRRAHVPDLRGARGAARPAARGAGAALVHALERTRTLRLAERRLERRAQRRPPLVPARLAEGARDRPRDRPRRVPLPRTARRRAPICVRSSLGRYSPAKGLDVVLRAVRLALDDGLDVRLEVYGPALNPEERAHRGELERLVEELDLARRVKLGHAVLRSEVPELLARADVLVNNMRAGATDKVVYEACASCLPALASNPAFDALLPDELRFEPALPTAARAAPGRPRSSADRALRDCAAERSASRSGAVDSAADAARGGSDRRSPLGRRTWADASASRLATRQHDGDGRHPRPPPAEGRRHLRAPRRTCSRSCRGCASAAGTSGC